MVEVRLMQVVSRPLLAALLALTATTAPTQVITAAGPIPVVAPEDRASEEIDRLHPLIVERAQPLLKARASSLEAQTSRSALGNYIFPLRMSATARGYSAWGISNFVDHDASSGLRDFSCSARTYDGHRGTDFFTWPFGIQRLENDDAVVVAAASGNLVGKSDGAADRNCVPLSIQPQPPANYVAILHDDGTYGYYLHLKSGSLTTKAIGSRVIAGERLGIVASSGLSTGPHLHFEIRGADGTTIDPFSGACDSSPTLWKHQWNAASDFKLVQISTHDAAPQFASCNTTTNSFTASDQPNYRDSFSIGQTIYAMAATRDFPLGGYLRFQIVAPNGQTVIDRTFSPSTSSYKAAYWYVSFQLGSTASAGIYRVLVTSSSGEEGGYAFAYGTTLASTTLAAAVLPGGRSVRSNTTATVFATIINSGQQAAEGCLVQLDTPLAGTFSYQATDPSTNAPIGLPNTPVRIEAGAAKSFVLSFKPSDAAVSKAAAANLRFKCTNAPAAAIYEGVNTVLLSFDPDPIPDIIPVAATPSGDGVVRIAGPNGTQAWSAASVNIGAGATLAVTPELTGTTSASVVICETNPNTGACLLPPGQYVSPFFSPNLVLTFAVFVTANGTIGFDPANVRIRLNFVDAAGVTRGQTSVALTTQ
jgi:murein DD-endopeptidase MepM/ murein hydrolase activator NlpD